MCSFYRPQSTLAICFSAALSFSALLSVSALAGERGEDSSSTAQATPAERHPSPAAIDPSQFRFVDLTHPFDEDTIYWPTEEGFRLIPGPAGVTERGYYYAANRFVAAEHGGTHLDAPIHFYKGRQTIDQIPLQRLMGEGVVVDVSRKCEADRDYQIQIADLKRWEKTQGRRLENCIVLLRCGYSRHWKDRERYLGTDKRGAEAVKELHFPGLAPAAARWLAQERTILAVGIDTASIDYGQSRRFQSHVALFQKNIPVFENVANLDQLPATHFTVIALPMKIAQGTGAPLRIVTLVPRSDADEEKAGGPE